MARKANWNIKPLPKGQRVVPPASTLRPKCLVRMQNGGLTINGAIGLCRAFDKKRGKPANEGKVRNRAYALIRLVAKRNGYGAKEKNGRIKTAA